MMKSLFILNASIMAMTVAGCGPKPPPATPSQSHGEASATATSDSTAVTDERTDAELIAVACQRFDVLNTAYDCGARMSEDECIESLSASEHPDEAARQRRRQTLLCMENSQSCSEFGTCIVEEERERQARTGPRKCGEQGWGSISLSQSEADARYGQGASKYSDLPSSHDKPIEVCGVEGQVTWLMTATCDDGSQPFLSGTHAHRARVGSLGPGGRCQGVIDLYRVPCPEKTYEIYMDMYMCGPGQSAF